MEDREYILGQVAALDGGLGAVTARVAGDERVVGEGGGAGAAAGAGGDAAAQQGGTAAEGSGRLRGGRAAVSRGGAGEARNARGSAQEDPHLDQQPRVLLKAKGDLRAEPLMREALQAKREAQLGDGTRVPSPRSAACGACTTRHRGGRAAVPRGAAGVAKRSGSAQGYPQLDRQLAALLHAKGDLAAAEPLMREVLQAAAKRSGIGTDTLISINNLQLLRDKSDSRGRAADARGAAGAAALEVGIPIPSPRSTTSPCFCTGKANETKRSGSCRRRSLPPRRCRREHPHTQQFMQNLAVMQGSA